MASVWDGLTPKIEAVLTKLNSQSQTLKEMEDREAKVRHLSRFWFVSTFAMCTAGTHHSNQLLVVSNISMIFINVV